MTRRLLFRRAVAAVAAEETVKRIEIPEEALRAIRIYLGEDSAAAVDRYIAANRAMGDAEVRRLRGEVRRLRRVIRTPRVLEDYSVCRYCGAGVPLDVDARIKHHPGCIAEAALAPRRRSK